MYLNTDCHTTCAGIISGASSANNNDAPKPFQCGLTPWWIHYLCQSNLGFKDPLLRLHQDEQELNFRLVAALSTNVICLGPVGLVENK